MAKEVQQLKNLMTKNEDGSYIYRAVEAPEAAERIVLATLEALGESEIAQAYRELKTEMNFEYGDE